jgi:guanylate kinase
VIEFQLNREGILFVLSAPSGGGKSTILRELLKADPTMEYSVSVTTRQPRGDEKDGREYHFRTIEEFKRLQAGDAFVESAHVHGNYYGTLRTEVEQRLSEGADVILDIDVQGSLKLKKERPDTVLVFVLPPSIATLEKRRRSRGLDDDRAVRVRLDNARHEIKYANLYDYVLVNERLEETIEAIQQVITAERQRAHRMIINDALGEIEFLKPQAMAGAR